MLGGFPLDKLASPPALLGFAILLIFLGILVPRRFYKEKVEECERWRTAFEIQRDRADASDAQSVELLELAKTTHALIVALFNSKPDRNLSSGEQNVV